jgi:hypothetical protein
MPLSNSGHLPCHFQATATIMIGNNTGNKQPQSASPNIRLCYPERSTSLYNNPEIPAIIPKLRATQRIYFTLLDFPRFGMTSLCAGITRYPYSGSLVALSFLAIGLTLLGGYQQDFSITSHC